MERFLEKNVEIRADLRERSCEGVEIALHLTDAERLSKDQALFRRERYCIQCQGWKCDCTKSHPRCFNVPSCLSDCVCPYLGRILLAPASPIKPEQQQQNQSTQPANQPTWGEGGLGVEGDVLETVIREVVVIRIGGF